MWIFRAVLWIVGSIIATAGAEAVAKEVVGRQNRKPKYIAALVLAVFSFFISMVIIPIVDPYTAIWVKFFLSLGIGATVGGLSALLLFIVYKRRSRRKLGLVKMDDKRWR